ncbi:Phosphoglycerol transferase I [Clarias magur]|uniref:Phosphoglycerol transferase I n=1 Tax=Clarias magur TaxID=1594786 RepID=A0A8J4TKB3_CLAMG|nr:Phosphoglycerol transferase I [Clarias magur]
MLKRFLPSHPNLSKTSSPSIAPSSLHREFCSQSCLPMDFASFYGRLVIGTAGSTLYNDGLGPPLEIVRFLRTHALDGRDRSH